MKPVFALKALDHIIVYQLGRMGLIAHAIDVKERLIVLILAIFVGFALKSWVFLHRAIYLTG